MAINEVQASGLEYLALATELLQRARLADAEAGVWEAADLQWWWRTPRRSDAIDQLFWVDDEGPVAGVVLTDWGRAWGCDPFLVPGVSNVPLSTVWARAVEAINALGLEAVEVLVRDDDFELLALLAGSGFVADDTDPIAWMDAQDRPTWPPCRTGSRSSTAPRRRPARIRCGDEAAKGSRPASGSARSTTRHSTSPSRLLTARPPVTRSSGSTP